MHSLSKEQVLDYKDKPLDKRVTNFINFYKLDKIAGTKTDQYDVGKSVWMLSAKDVLLFRAIITNVINDKDGTSYILDEPISNRMTIRSYHFYNFPEALKAYISAATGYLELSSRNKDGRTSFFEPKNGMSDYRISEIGTIIEKLDIESVLEKVKFKQFMYNRANTKLALKDYFNLNNLTTQISFDTK